MRDTIQLYRACVATCNVLPPDEEGQAAALHGGYFMSTHWAGDTLHTRRWVGGLGEVLSHLKLGVDCDCQNKSYKLFEQ